MHKFSFENQPFFVRSGSSKTHSACLSIKNTGFARDGKPSQRRKAGWHAGGAHAADAAERLTTADWMWTGTLRSPFRPPVQKRSYVWHLSTFIYTSLRHCVPKNGTCRPLFTHLCNIACQHAPQVYIDDWFENL